MDPRETGWEVADFIRLVGDRDNTDQWREIVKAVMNLGEELLE
jgi:hypothetical protein